MANVVWQKRTSPDARIHLGPAQDHILVYSGSDKPLFYRLPHSEGQTKQYKNPDDDPRGPWTSSDYTAQGWRPNQMYEITTPGGKKFLPPPGRCWGNIESVYQRLLAEGRLWFGSKGDARPRVKTYLAETEGISSWTWWTHGEAGHNQEAKKETNTLFGGDNAFDTPKPERLISRIFSVATLPGDFVLDSFLGSGTTAAVAHKMGRRYIGIEMGEHAVTHVVPRLQKVVEGEQGGISKAVDWQGGSGFRFFRLGEPVFDAYGQLNRAVSFAALAAHIWFAETHIPYSGPGNAPLIGVHSGIAYYLLYNGILGDKRPAGGNILTHKVLADLPEHAGLKVIYGEACRIGEARLQELGITFRQIPYDIKVR